DANGCTGTASVTITEPTVLSAAGVATNVSCNGGSNGTVDLTVTGGTGTYTYLWSNNATTEDLTGLMAGTYDVTVTDANGCTATASVTVTEPTVLSASATATNVSCNGGNNGTANLTVTGGTGTYTYLWSNNATTEDLTGLAAGTYSVTVTDANGCTATASVTITEPTVLSASATATNVSCNGGNNGTADLTVTGGTGTYTYLWSNGATTQDLTGLMAGTYSVTVTDANGCTATASVTVTQPTAISATATATNVSCNGGTNGTATVTATGGTGAYTYSWTGTEMVATPFVFQGFEATGSWNYTFTPAIYNISNDVWAIVENVGSIATASEGSFFFGIRDLDNPNGGGNFDHTITFDPIDVSAQGDMRLSFDYYSVEFEAADVLGYVVELDNGTTWGPTVELNRNTGAWTTVNIDIPASANFVRLRLIAKQDGASDFAGFDNVVLSTLSGPQTASISGLAAGTYGVTVTDANGCTATASVTVTEPAVLSASATATNVSCNGGNNGAADLTVTGGTSPYTYLWSNSATTQDLTGLAAGTYDVTVTDANGCTATASVTVTQPTALVATAASQVNVLCNGAATGSATVSATGGTGTYTYSWAPSGGTAATATGLMAGTYTVTVTDANGCTATQSFTITQPDALVATAASQVNILCNGGTNGSATVTVAGGVSPYTYAWDNGATGATATDLAAGTYVVTVTDANNCTTTQSFTITQPAALVATAASQVNVLCNGAETGSATVGVTGGVSPYTYAWDNGATGATATDLAAGTYVVTVTDANSCTTTQSFTISEPDALAATTSVDTPVSCFGGNEGVATVAVTGGVTPYTYLWSNNATTATISGLTAGTYDVTVTDANGCTTTASVTVTEPAEVMPPAADAQVFCNFGTVAELEATGTDVQWYDVATGGSPLAGTASLTTATYYATQTVDGCESPTRTAVAVTVNITPAPTASAQTFCNSATVADLTSSGTDVQWYTAATGGTALANDTALATGTYYVSQTLNECESTRAAVSITVNVTPAPTATAQTFCNSATVAELTATGTDIKWYANETGGTELLDTAELATGTYYVSQTLNNCEGPRAAVSVTVNVTPAPAAVAQTFCNAATVADLEAEGTGTILWYADATGGTALADATALANGTTYYASQTLNGCESTTRTAVAVTINVTTAPTADAQVFCSGATVADLSATGTAIMWYANATGGTALADDTALATGTYYATQTANGCESATRTAVTVTVNVTPAPTADAQVFCNSATVADLSATGDNLLWYADATGGTALADDTALATGTYYVSQTLNDCESPRTAVAVTVNVTPAPVAEAQTFCDSATVADLSATGDNLAWYADATGGTALADDTALATGTYYVSQTLNNCEGPRTAVAVTIQVTEAPVATDLTLCEGATVADLTAEGTDILWYADETGGEPLAGDDVLVSGTTYYASQTVNGCESAARTAVAVTITVTPAPTGEAAQVVGENATFANLTVEGTDIVWYANAEDAANHVNPLDPATILEDGVIYYATQTLDGCESVASLAVTVTVSLRTDSFERNKLFYYPVPVVDVLTIENNNMINRVTVIDLLGQVVITQDVNATTAKVDMRSLQGATYIVQIETEYGIETVKVVRNSNNN
ncbi:T9SS type A sorting domain-containing protein, partial [Flavobacterium sp. D11R37]|uniref:Ig-like domain-containing protein n=1 Tax=Flavobacterium coralii TaxID=2838017 RepID=UPI001CA70C48